MNEAWIREYLVLMFLSSHDPDASAKAAGLKYKYMPAHLYKYRTFSKEHLAALKKGVLYFTAAGALNDVKEANMVITEEAKAALQQEIYDDLRSEYGFPEARITNFDDMMSVVSAFYKERSKYTGIDFLSTPEYARLRTESMLEQDKLINNMLIGDRNMFSVCSFSAANDVNQMWAHYADSHQGFCIEYDFKSLGIDDLLTALLFPVVYAEDNRIFISNTNYYLPS